MKQRRRVAFALNSWTFGGVEEHVVLLCEGLPDHGFDPTVVCGPPIGDLKPLHERLGTLGTSVIVLPLAGGGPVRKMAALCSLARALKDRGTDILHVQLISHDSGKLPMAAGVCTRTPMVVTHHTAPAHVTRRQVLRSPLLAQVRHFVAVSDQNRRAQIQFMGLPANRLRTIHNGIVLPQLDGMGVAARSQLRAELRLPPSTPLVGSVGRLSDEKGLHWLLDAAPAVLEHVADAHFVFIGSGPLMEPLKLRAAALGLVTRTHWLGFRPNAKELVAGLDVLALPSVIEGLPLVLLEAMGAAVPVVANAVGGVPEAVRDGVDGFLVTPGNTAMLATRLVEVLMDPEGSRKLGGRARERIESMFTADRMTVRTAELYREILG